MKKIAIYLLSVLMVLLTAVPAFAAEDDYTYTVRIYAGEQGTINGEDVLVYENVSYGTRINFSLSQVQLKNDSKYYVKGIRESGRDNNTVGTNSFVVEKDTDYVVAYGILGDAVQYTINYVDENGNTLAPSETYYGNVGDRPVVAYLYIEGYQPQAYNLTRTLGANAAENVFDFTYRPVETQVIETPTEGEETTPGTTPAAGENAGGEGAGAAAGGEGAAAGGEGAAAGAEGGTDENAAGTENAGGENAGTEDEQEQNTEPEEILDLDVPLAGPDANADGDADGTATADQPADADASGSRGTGFFQNTAAVVGTAAGVVVVGGGLIWFLIRRKKKVE